MRRKHGHLIISMGHEIQKEIQSGLACFDSVILNGACRKIIFTVCSVSSCSNPQGVDQKFLRSITQTVATPNVQTSKILDHLGGQHDVYSPIKRDGIAIVHRTGVLSLVSSVDTSAN